MHTHTSDRMTRSRAGGLSAAAEEAQADPMLQLMGWRAEPLFRRRLKFYVFEGIAEVVVLGLAIRSSVQHLGPGGLFARLLGIPLGIAVLRLLWSARLFVSYKQVKHADVATIIRNLGSIHTRSCWSCSAATFVCLSCVLMVWYGILFLLFCTYEIDNAKEAPSVYLNLCVVAFSGLAHWAFWRDFVANFREDEGEPRDLQLVYRLRAMYRSKAIRLVPFKKDDIEAQSLAEACAVCLEDFNEKEIVAQLPCGHTFHPTCANKWLREDWRCPMRCTLSPKGESESDENPMATVAPPAGLQNSIPEQHSDEAVDSAAMAQAAAALTASGNELGSSSASNGHGDQVGALGLRSVERRLSRSASAEVQGRIAAAVDALRAAVADMEEEFVDLEAGDCDIHGGILPARSGSRTQFEIIQGRRIRIAWPPLPSDGSTSARSGTVA